MRNYIQHGDMIYVTAPSGGMTSGTLYVFGAIFGIAGADALENETCALWNGGRIYLLPKETDIKIDMGDYCYWDASEVNISGAESTGKVKVGVCTKAAAQSDTTVEVKLNPSF